MENKIFRKKSLERLTEPEQLSDYLRVTRPAIWIALIAVIVVIVGLFLWANFVSIESALPGKAAVSDGVMTITFQDQLQAKNIETGMNVNIGDEDVPVTSVGTAENGAIIAGAHANVPDGTYDVSVTFKSSKVLSFLFN